MTTDHKPLLPDFATALRRLGDAAVVGEPGLMAALSGASAAEAAVWRAEWPAIAAERRRWIADQMLASAEADIHLDFRTLFTILLDDPDPEVRATAIDGLWEDTDLSLIDRFDRMLADDADNGVRMRAATALGSFVERGEFENRAASRVAGALEHLLRVAGDEREDVEVRRRALESAGYADRDDVRDLIGRAIASPHGPLKAGALRAMGHSADEEWGAEVLAWLDESEPELRFEAARASGELQLQGAVPRLATLVTEDNDRQIRIEAIWALGEIGGPRARRVLERVATQLDDEDDEDLATAVDDAMATAALADGEIGWDAFVAGSGLAARHGIGAGGLPGAGRDVGDDGDDDEDEIDEDDDEDFGSDDLVMLNGYDGAWGDIDDDGDDDIEDLDALLDDDDEDDDVDDVPRR